MKNAFYLLFIIMFCLTNSGFSANYYVSPSGDDLNPGTLTAPTKSINQAIQKAFAGDKIIVRDGIYREEVKFIRSGESGAPITLTNFDGETVIISGAEALTNWNNWQNSIYWTNIDFQTLQVWEDTHYFLRSVSSETQMEAGTFFYDAAQARLYVWCSDSRHPQQHLIEAGKRHVGINCTADEQATGCSYIELRANNSGSIIIQNVMGSEFDAFGVYLSYGSDYNVVSGASKDNRNFIIRCVGRWWCDQANSYQGIQLRKNTQTDGAQHNLVQFTDISYCGDKGIQLWGENTSFNTVRYNRVHDNGVHGIVPNRNADANIIEWNEVWGQDGGPGKINEGGAGIKVDDANRNIIRYNICYENAYGIGIIENCEDTQIYHNISIDNYGISRQSGYGLMCRESGCRYTDIRNNIFMNNRTAQIYFDEAAANNPGHIFQANNIFVDRNRQDIAYLRWGNSGYITLDEWETLIDPPVKSKNFNPNFTNIENHDFQLRTSSPLIDAGVDLNQEFIGSAPDIGVFEANEKKISATITSIPGQFSMNGDLKITIKFSEEVNKTPYLLFKTEGNQEHLVPLSGELPANEFKTIFKIKDSILDGDYQVLFLDDKIDLVNNMNGIIEYEPSQVHVDKPPLIPNRIQLDQP